MRVGLDRSKALRRAVLDVLDPPVIQRYADLRIMPMWSLIPVRGNGFALARSPIGEERLQDGQDPCLQQGSISRPK